MNLCIDCRFFTNTGTSQCCIRDSVLENETTKRSSLVMSPVDGKPIQVAMKMRLDKDAFAERTTGACGMDAVNFEARK